MQAYKLKFHSALHVDSKGSGEPADADGFIRSDTLSAALCIAWSTIFRDTGPDFFENPPFTVGSAFPYTGDILMFPAPAWPVWNVEDDALRKRLKAVEWISLELFEQVASGDALDFQSIRFVSGSVAVSEQEANKYPDLCKQPPWAHTERQRVSMDRMGMQNEGGLFFFALQFFAPHAGLYFLANMAPEIRPGFRAALDYLGDTGIGADRNSGLGHFKADDGTDFPIERFKSRDGWITLSLFNPKPSETAVFKEKCAYGLTTRSGWIVNTTIGRPPIRAFTEGSYFSKKPEGRVVPMINEKVRTSIDQKTGGKYSGSLNHSAPRDFRAVCLPCAEPEALKEVNHD